ncbi:hypothetical protein ACH5RR_033783 [Cinchona calisaya]|uniref:Uncharacterized protein n=1 Tax=Cinchona calisaya TaxID=153742 RepID=A0ABD2YDK1_9GENT
MMAAKSKVVHGAALGNVATLVGIGVESRARNAGFAPAMAILGKAKELPKERDVVSPFAFGEENAKKKASFAQVFLLHGPLLGKGLFDQEVILVG